MIQTASMFFRGEGGVFKFLLVPPPKSVMSSCMCPTYSALQGLPYAFWLCLGLCFCCCFRTLRYLYSVCPPYPAPHGHLGLLCEVSMPTLTPGSSPNWPTTISQWEKWERNIYKTDNNKSYSSTYFALRHKSRLCVQIWSDLIIYFFHFSYITVSHFSMSCGFTILFIRLCTVCVCVTKIKCNSMHTDLLAIHLE